MKYNPIIDFPKIIYELNILSSKYKMNSRYDKKSHRTSPSCKSSTRTKSQLKPSISNKKNRQKKQETQPPLVNLRALIVLQKKYSERQISTHFSEKINKMMQNTNKANTQLKLLCSQKQYMSKIFTNSFAIIHLRINSHHHTHLTNHISGYRNCMMPQLSSETRIWVILRSYKKQKLNLLNRIRKSQTERNIKIQTPILSTLDDSENNLKYLVNNIEYMIKCQSNQSSINIINEIKVKERQKCEIQNCQKQRKNNEQSIHDIYDDHWNGISEIMEQHEEQVEGKRTEIVEIGKQQTKKLIHRKKVNDYNNIHKILVTQPLFLQNRQKLQGNHMNDQYGILKTPPKQIFFRRKKNKGQLPQKINKSGFRQLYTRSMDASNEKTTKQRSSNYKLTKSVKRSKEPLQIKKEQPEKIVKKKHKKSQNQIKTSYYKSSKQPYDLSKKTSTRSHPKKLFY